MQEKTARFAVINILAESPTSETIFGEETVKRFKRFTEEGAVYVPIQTEVAIEKADWTRDKDCIIFVRLNKLFIKVYLYWFYDKLKTTSIP